MEQKKKALGRGLEQLFSSEVLDFDSFENKVIEESKESDIKEINVDEIRSNPYQPRKNFDQTSLDELAQSIKTYGIFQPIIVKKSIKGYDLIAGERRLRATKLAGLKTIPAIVKNMTDEQMREIALLENLQREDLSAIELAWAYKDIIDNSNIKQEDLALKIGKSRSHVTNILGLLRLPKEVQNLILDNKLTMGHARILSKLDDDKLIIELANKVIDNDLSVRDLELMTSDPNVKRKKEIKKKTVDDNYYYVQKELRDKLDTKVKVTNKKIEIFYDNNDMLDHILEIFGIKMD